MTGRLTKVEAQALAAFITRVRPDWDAPGIVACLGKAAHLGTPLEVAIACLELAKNPALSTPGLLPERGRHWTQADGQHGANVREPATPPDPVDDEPAVDPAVRASLLAQARAAIHRTPNTRRVPPPGDQTVDDARRAELRARADQESTP